MYRLCYNTLILTALIYIYIYIRYMASWQIGSTIFFFFKYLFWERIAQLICKQCEVWSLRKYKGSPNRYPEHPIKLLFYLDLVDFLIPYNFSFIKLMTHSILNRLHTYMLNLWFLHSWRKHNYKLLVYCTIIKQRSQLLVRTKTNVTLKLLQAIPWRIKQPKAASISAQIRGQCRPRCGPPEAY